MWREVGGKFEAHTRQLFAYASQSEDRQSLYKATLLLAERIPYVLDEDDSYRAIIHRDRITEKMKNELSYLLKARHADKVIEERIVEGNKPYKDPNVVFVNLMPREDK